jgi:hypothetical protein
MNGAFQRSGFSAGGDLATAIKLAKPVAHSAVAACRQICSDGVRPLEVRKMSRAKSNRTYLIASAALGALTLGLPSQAADLKLPVKAPYLQPVFDWTGFYIGGHTGYSRGSNSAVSHAPVKCAIC